MLARAFLFVTTSILATPPSAAQQFHIGIVSAGDLTTADCWVSDVTDFLTASLRFSSVTAFDALAATPTLTELQNFDAVLTYSNYDYHDSVALGDVLADYVDSGGAVVVASFSHIVLSPARRLRGRWETGGYEVIEANLGIETSFASLGQVVVPGHPVMNGVTTLSGASAFRPLPSTSILQGSVIARWSDGAILAAVGDNPARVDLGLFPPSDRCTSGPGWTFGQDGDVLIANALAFAASSGGVSIGTNYCSAAPNTTGVPGTMLVLGSPVALVNNITLVAENLPANQFGIFVVSRTQGFIPGSGGASNGNVCLGGTVGRFIQPGQIVSSGVDGRFSLPIDLTSIPQGSATASVVAGDTWNFQAWHRSNVGLRSNLTDGSFVTFH